MSLQTDTQLLATVPVFTLLEHEAIKLLAFHADVVRLNIGDVLFENGDKASGGIVVVDGEIQLLPANLDKSLQSIVRPGGLIGQLALITDVTHRATARAIAPSTVMRIDRTSFQKILREYPGSAARIRAAIAEDLLKFTNSLVRSRS